MGKGEFVTLFIYTLYGFPIAGIEMVKVAWAAVNRVTGSGKRSVLRSASHPPRSITADAAWQRFGGLRKGTLETGKPADTVILSYDPLKIDPMAIKDIRALRTIKEGQAVLTAKR